MADLTVQINEKITLDGNDRGVYTTQTITGINNIDNRIITIPIESYTGLFYFNPDEQSPATFLTGDFKYGRVTNKSANNIQLSVYLADDTSTNYIITPGNSFFLSSTAATGSYSEPDNFTYDTYISEILVAPSTSPAKIEYFIATT
jgi:hypothetical protein